SVNPSREKESEENQAGEVQVEPEEEIGSKMAGERRADDSAGPEKETLEEGVDDSGQAAEEKSAGDEELKTNTEEETATAKETSVGEEENEHRDEDDEEHHLDYSNYSKTQLVQAIESQ